MSFLKDKLRITCGKLWNFSHQQLATLENIEYQMAEYKTDNTPPVDGWQPFASGNRVQGKDGHAWFRVTFTTPPAKEGFSYYARFTTGREGQWDATNPQGLVYLNGEMVQGCDTNHTDVWLQPDTTYTMHNYFYMGMYDSPVEVNVLLFELDILTEQLYYDMKVAYDTCMLFHANSNEYIQMMDVLEQTANRIDLRAPMSEAYHASIAVATEYIQRELYEKLCSTEGKPVVSCIGHTHIDVEWLWHRAQTREKIQRSFATANTLMKAYPEYKFMLSQPELYRYLKEEAPEKYAELKAWVAEGRWEPEGSMYVEADCNLISGESFVRQIIHGKRFFKEEFGVDCRVLFLPDVFGYSAAMPQILKKCGVDHFVTSKISWNETNCMPVDCFMWEGIDGTAMFTNFITTQEYRGPDPWTGTNYVGHMTPSEVKGCWNKFLQKDYANRVLNTYGHGDGGGGPTKEMLEYQRRLAKGLPGMPVTKTESLINHLDKTRAEFDEGCRRTGRTPKWVGELYLEYHRGTYTSIAKNKKGNRKAEWQLQQTEALSTTDMLFGGTYDADGLKKAWRKVLHNQFHDIIPGSSIFEVYEGTDRDYAEIADYCGGVSGAILGRLAEKAGGEGDLLVYNPLGFARKGMLTLDGKTVELTEEIPAFGWKVLKAPVATNHVTVSGRTVENAYYTLTLDECGRIESLYDKTADRQVLKAGCKGNEIQVFEDYPRDYDAWEISEYYQDKMWVLDDPAVITPVEDGSRAGFRVTKTYMNSTITQTVWLYTDSRRIDFDNDIDWHEEHQLVKAAFPLDVCTASATYEIQFGHVQRPTHRNTSWDKAKFEVYGHKWVDLSEDGYGVSLLNDCKYGYSTEGSTLKLTMLKCATYPNPHADKGRHTFTYALLPHEGGFREAGVIREAYNLNQPLTAVAKGQGDGSLPATFSLVSCDKENVVVETVKKAEYGDGTVVRMYDSWGRRSKVTLTVADGFKKAYLCDMLENELEELSLENGQITLPVGNFEIVTLKFK